MKCRHEGCDDEAVVSGARIYRGEKPTEENLIAAIAMPRCKEHMDAIFNIEFGEKRERKP